MIATRCRKEPPAVSPASTADQPVSRVESLARIAALTAVLRAHHRTPPDAFVWSYREDSRWWSFGRFGRFTVATPERFGWAVGDYPWEGAVKQGRDTFTNEVFVKPTFVDAQGRIAPLDATRASPADNHLITDEMCRDIADRMEQITTAQLPDPPVPDDHKVRDVQETSE
jgi:hypothetical protein